MREVSIRACGDYYAPVTDTPPDLRALAKEATGKPVRRVGRFIQLSLIGAARCVGAAALPADTAVYVGSRSGDLEVTIEVMEELFRDGQPPKPLSFINTVSNAGCFYVARHFGLYGRSCFSANSTFSFETALQLALLDLESGVTRSALVGGVDHVSDPLPVHRQRVRLAADAPVAEASHWVWLQADGEGAVRVRAMDFFQNREALIAWARTQNLPASALFARGQYLDPAQADSIAKDLGLARRLNEASERAHYGCQAAGVLGDFAKAAGEALLYVSADAHGGYAAMLAAKRS
jgi:Beta-ketoacyl synthase, N-terminal domain